MNRLDDPMFARLRSQLIEALTKHVEPIFAPGTILTLVARDPDKPDYFVFISDDDIDAVGDLLKTEFLKLPPDRDE